MIWEIGASQKICGKENSSCLYFNNNCATTQFERQSLHIASENLLQVSYDWEIKISAANTNTNNTNTNNNTINNNGKEQHS